MLEKTDLIIEKDEQIKGLTERLQQMTNKLYESKNAYVTLKQDFNKAQKLLCSEVGENVSVTTLSSQYGGWRGRAEQIHQLQQKISELQLKISSSDASRRKSLEGRSSSSIRNTDRDRKQQIENLSKELKDAESTLESTKKKFEAAKARIAVLENDFNMSKKTIALLNEKTTHDNQLIKALHDQLKIIERKFEDREFDIKKQNQKLQREIVLLKSELEASQIHLKNFKRQLDDKEKEIEIVKKESNLDRKAVVESQQTNDLRETSMQSPRNCARDANEYIAIGIAAEAERERLLELVTVLNRRLDKERNDFEQLSESFRKERNRGVKLETKLRKMELERVVLSKVNTGSYRLKAPKLNGVPNNISDDSEEFRLKFELLQEECLTLKTRLTTIKKDKCADLVMFKKMLDQTRKIFKDAHR
ncbi:PREDICTED: coiled-coil domain-containing protein 13-like [Ceratosolen solmsi marchali]|uniref:Coiled-coil domain-containing protein 13-like n=1 Tax=Ceratosolen solmsi marchali TaxID=326594 RepID=A0AAJ7DYQ8_9HYME|nr:PREDICTED: coiled-coil domain-containing protein 13-like [Ceratosolen solmsi marchali]